MHSSLSNVFLKIPEPEKSTLLFLRHFFVNDMKLQEQWKFNTPFYYYKEKWFCYLSYSSKRNHEIYVGFVKGYKIEVDDLVSEGRKQIKVYRVNPYKDIDIILLEKIVELQKQVYK